MRPVLLLRRARWVNDVIPRPQQKSQKVFTPLLEIRNLTKSFDGQAAVDDVNLTIYKGEIFDTGAKDATSEESKKSAQKGA